MFIEELPYKFFFIALHLQGGIVIGLTKKLIAPYVAGDLAFLD